MNSITELRKKKKLSQRKLAELVGISQQAIAQYELGSSHPKPAIARRLAEALEVPEEDIFKTFYRK